MSPAFETALKGHGRLGRQREPADERAADCRAVPQQVVRRLVCARPHFAAREGRQLHSALRPFRVRKVDSAALPERFGGVGGGRSFHRRDARRPPGPRSEEHTSELQSLMRLSYAVFCLKKKNKTKHNITS